MNILTEQKQNNNSVYNTIKPLSNLKFINNIYVVRDSPAYNINKVKYICPNKFFLKTPLLKTVSKLFLMLKTSFKYKPDLVIGIDMVPHTVNAIICSKIFKIPVIGSLRGQPYTYFRGDEKPFMHFILKNVDILTTTGNSSKKQMSKKITKNKIYILPNSIDTSKFRSRKRKRIYDIINVGRLHESKNLDTFLKVVSNVRKKIPKLKVAIIGDGPEEKKLKQLSKKMGLEKTVSFLGFKKNPENHYPLSKLFLLPTKREGLPMTIIEAMCCGCVPVVSKVGDIEDVCRNNFNSILIQDPSNSKAFEKAIIKLLTNKKIFGRLSKNSAKIKEKYSYKSAENVWGEMFKKLKLIN